jgi:hypothetical protein
MKTLMSIAIAAALTLSVVPAMVDVSAGAQEPDLSRVAKYITVLSEMAGLMAQDIQGIGVQALDLNVGVALAPSPVGTLEATITVTCRDKGACERSGGKGDLEAIGYKCSDTTTGFRCTITV